MKKLNADIVILIAAIAVMCLLFFLGLYVGSVKISWSEIFTLISGGEVENKTWSYIIESRFNRSIVAVFAGAALSISGLVLQVYFRNPLAGPGVLGITSGASLGVAFVILGGVGLGSLTGSAIIIVAGILGAFLVLTLLLFVSRYIQNSVTLLVVGLMFGYFASAIINILFLWADVLDTREYVVWGLGSFEGLDYFQVLPFIIIVTFFILFTLILIRSLNAFALGADYAGSLGINLKQFKLFVLIITSVLAAIVTVYCGPISFIGIAVPQLVRIVVRSKNHAMIIPFAIIVGACLALAADLTVRLSHNSLPLNAVTALIGAPVIIYTIVKMNKRHA